MKQLTFMIAGCLMLFVTAVNAATVNYIFEDLDKDETFNVSVEVLGDDSNGLATYNIALAGLDGSPLDPTTFSWAEATLKNLSTNFRNVGFQAGLLDSNVGTDGYSATNSQFNNDDFLPGVGQVPVQVEAFAAAPDNFDIDLGVPALLGQLTLPGANELTDGELSGLIRSSAALFTGSNATEVRQPDEVSSIVQRVPEPAALVLVGIGMIGLICGQRRSH